MLKNQKMKLILNIFTFFIIQNIFSQEQFKFNLANFDVNKTVSQIFEAEFDDKENVFYWSPNYDERFKIKYESEKYLMTAIGTIIYNSEKTFYTIVTFTFRPNEKLPILGFIGLEVDKTNQYLNIRHINKLIGETDLLLHPKNIDIIELDKNNYFIKTTSVFDVFENLGTKSLDVKLYYFGKEIFLFNQLDKGRKEGFNYLNQTDFKIDTINNEIILTTSGSKYDYKQKKIIPLNETKKYTFWFLNELGLSKIEKKY